MQKDMMRTKKMNIDQSMVVKPKLLRQDPKVRYVAQSSGYEKARQEEMALGLQDR